MGFTYDAADRLTGKTWNTPGNINFLYAYDDANRLTALEKKDGLTVISSMGITYNAANQVTAISAEGRTTSYTYDAAQRMNQVTYPSAQVVKYGFNSRSLLTSIRDFSNVAFAEYEFDDAGRMTKKLLPNGLEVVYSYNDANWVTAITLRQTSNPSNVIQSFEYGYDQVGNRLWVRNADGRGDVYKYDSTYQLVGVKYNVLDPAAGYDMAQGHSRSVTYHYDALGNRTQVVDGSTLTEYSGNNLNQITQVGTNDDFAYDADGNLTGDGTWTYGYDREGRLISATDGTTSVTYSYDAVGRRMSKTVGSTTTQYVYSGQDLIEERDGSGAVLARYIYAGGIDNPVAVVQGTNTFFYQQDALGNVTALTDSTGAIVESYTYDVFGQPTIKDGNGDPVDEPMQPFLFTGREWDHETGLYHYRTRAYSPELGRFLQADSIGFGGGDLNLYRYVGNNPVNYVDPMGFCADCEADFNACKDQAKGIKDQALADADRVYNDVKKAIQKDLSLAQAECSNLFPDNSIGRNMCEFLAEASFGAAMNAAYAVYLVAVAGVGADYAVRALTCASRYQECKVRNSQNGCDCP